LSAVALIAVVACDSTSPTSPVQVTGVTVTGPANTVAIGTSLQLQATVLPAGVPQGVTWSTSDPMIATVDNAGLVLGIGPGPVTITATSTTDNTASGSILLTVTGCPAPRMVTTNPAGNVTWQNWIASPMCFDYIVTTNINMSAGVLTIEPGTIVGFQAGITMRIAGTAGLIAFGTPTDRIRLTGTQQARGHWGGIFFDNSSNGGNRLEYITIEYAGVNNWSPSVIRANVMLVNSITTLFEAVLQESAAYGLFVDANTTLPISADNVFTRNAMGPVYTYASQVHNVVLGVPNNTVPGFSGNDRDVFDVVPNVVAGAGHRWHAIGIPYRILQVTNRQAFQVTGDLTVLPPATIEFEQDMALLVRDGGRLQADGVLTIPVTFTATTKTPGWWRGIGLQDTNSSLTNAIIEYGGGAIIGLGDQEPANLQITTGDATTPTVVQMLGVILRHSAGYGLYARSIDVQLSLVQTTMTQNALGAAYVDAPLMSSIRGSLTGNGIDRIHVNVSARTITSDATWNNSGVPIVLDGRGIGTPILTVQDATLTLSPGVEVQFDTNMGLDIRNGGLNAVGTPNSPIVMRPSGAAWRGIRLLESTGTLDHLTITGGGASNWGAVAHPGNLVIASAQNPAQVAIGDNITSTPFSQYGLVFSFGQTVAVRCAPMGQVYIPPPDTPAMHCPSG
jgi:hypothetical protein